MNKKLVVGLVLGVLLIGAVLLYVFREKLIPGSDKITSPAGSQTSAPKESFNWQLWEDPAGFSFEYPKEFKLDPHPEDETSYAHLEITSPNQPGNITITVNDADYPDIESWMSEDELVKDGSGLDTKVASMAAKKVALGKNREITAFIDWDQVVYLVDATGENRDYWKPIYNHILDSFKLTPLEGESAEEFDDWLGGFDTSGVDVVEAVEVIE
jgi:hypothetical protein